MHTSKLEGVNNRIKVIKRIAYGFHDPEYFALKVKQALPGRFSDN
jgi:transposase